MFKIFRNKTDMKKSKLGFCRGDLGLFDGEKISAGSIMVRQRGTKIHPGENVSKGGDDTLFSKIDGVVKFSTKNGRKLVNVIPK